MIELGGNITLVGFKEIGFSELVVVKKLVGNYARKISDKIGSFENLTLSVKPVHRTSDNVASQYELKAKILVNGQLHNADTTDFNLFAAIDNCMKKINTILRIDE